MNPTSWNVGSRELNLINQRQQQYQINTISASHTQQPPLNLPCQDLLDEGRSEDYLKICFPLYKASIKGDWEAAKDILDKHEELVRFSINRNYETALHVAVYEGNTLFVENLVSLMQNKDMELQNSSSNTALCLAAVAGHVAIAEIMVTKHKALLDIAGSQGKMPLYMAALSGKHDMVKYLYENSERMSGGFWTHESRGCVLLSCVEAELFDVALQIVNARPELAISGGSVLGVLARKPHAFRTKRTLIDKLTNQYKGLIDEKNQAVQLLRIIWANIVKLPKAKIDDILRGPADQIDEDEKLTTPGKATTSKIELPKAETKKYSSRILFVAAEMGNTAFIVELIRQYPERVLELNDNKQSIFHVAVSHRHENIYSLLYEIGSIKDSIINLEDENGNNMLHLVGILSETAMSNQLQDIAGAVLQMRQELIWFKEVKAILPPSLREKKNTAGLSPHELFTERHKGLVFKGEEWMKKTSSELMVVAALIATISFAAAITFVGGYNQDTGAPVLSRSRYFNLFVITNGVSFLFASTSIFFVLSIISSRYAERDFLISLPTKLALVIGTLSTSMMYLMIAFSCNFFLLYRDKYRQIPNIMITCSYVVSLLFSYWMFTNFWFTFGALSKKTLAFSSKGIMY